MVEFSRELNGSRWGVSQKDDDSEAALETANGVGGQQPLRLAGHVSRGSQALNEPMQEPFLPMGILLVQMAGCNGLKKSFLAELTLLPITMPSARSQQTV